MVDKIKSWNVTCKRFVAFLDIMGFRDRVFREEHEDVKKMFESLYPSIYIIEKDAQKMLSGKISREKSDAFGESIIKPILFSDSIILVSNDDSQQSINYMLYNVEWILKNAMNIKIPMKGALAYGELTADINKSLYFGKPLIDAYELQNELQLYGAVLHHTIEKYLNDNKTLSILEKFALFRYPTPISTSIVYHYLVDWTRPFDEKIKILNLISEFYYIVSGKTRRYVDNTLEFVREVLKRKQEKKS